MLTIGKWLAGILLAGSSVGFAVLLIAMLQSNKHWLGKVVIAIGVVAACLLSFGLSYSLLVPANPTPVVRFVPAANETAKHRLFVLAHGFVGSGDWLVKVLETHLSPYGAVLAVNATNNGYDDELMARTIEAEVRKYEEHVGAVSVIAEGESQGSLTLARWLRVAPTRRINALVLNTGFGSRDHVKPPALLMAGASQLNGDPVSTQILRLWRRYELRKPTTPEPGFNPEWAKGTREFAFTVGSPLAYGQVKAIHTFAPLVAGEFTGRIDAMWYVTAQDAGTHDPMIHTEPARQSWRNAAPDATFRDETIEEWTPGMHCPIEKYGPLANILVATTHA